MRKLVGIIVGLLWLVSGISAQQKRETDSLVLSKFYSKLLDEERRIVVHLPLNYEREPNKRYPVMYVLDASRLDFDICDRLFTLSSSGLAPECIVVGILNNKGKRERDLTPPFMQTETDDSKSPYGNADTFLSFIRDELIPSIDSGYRTSGYQTITGHSRSGLFVLYTLMEQPQLFHARFCFSTPAWRFDNMIVKRLEDSLRVRLTGDRSYLFFSAGENENPNIIAGFNFMVESLKRVNPQSVVWDRYLTPNANHQTNPIFSSARAMLLWAKYYEPNDN